MVSKGIQVNKAYPQAGFQEAQPIEEESRLKAKKV